MFFYFCMDAYWQGRPCFCGVFNSVMYLFWFKSVQVYGTFKVIHVIWSSSPISFSTKHLSQTYIGLQPTVQQLSDSSNYLLQSLQYSNRVTLPDLPYRESLNDSFQGYKHSTIDNLQHNKFDSKHLNNDLTAPPPKKWEKIINIYLHLCCVPDA